MKIKEVVFLALSAVLIIGCEPVASSIANPAPPKSFAGCQLSEMESTGMKLVFDAYTDCLRATDTLPIREDVRVECERKVSELFCDKEKNCDREVSEAVDSCEEAHDSEVGELTVKLHEVTNEFKSCKGRMHELSLCDGFTQWEDRCYSAHAKELVEKEQ